MSGLGKWRKGHLEGPSQTGHHEFRVTPAGLLCAFLLLAAWPQVQERLVAGFILTEGERKGQRGRGFRGLAGGWSK